MNTCTARIIILIGTLLWASHNVHAEDSMQESDGITMTLRDVPISEAMEMLSRTGKVNVLLSDGVDSRVSVNLYEVSVDDAIHSIAHAAGFAVEYQRNSYFIVDRDEAGKYESGGLTNLRTFKVQYSDPEDVEGILENYLSSYGSITTLPERRLLVVEDTEPFLDDIARVLKELDQRPKLILIEAKILQIGLKDSESFGLDWTHLFNTNGGTGEFGTRGLSNPNSDGFFFELVTPDVVAMLNMLRTRDRLRTLSTPKLLTLEDHDAETIIGERLGYNVTTTIDTVTTTSVEFLESGVILKVRPSVDGNNRILLDVHPEVSTGSVSDDGIPNQTTTEVTTSMLVDSGKTVFIGGLIKRSAEQTREGMPVLGDIPVFGRLFSNKAMSSVNTELVVLITPYIVGDEEGLLDGGTGTRIRTIEEDLERAPRKIEEVLSQERYMEEVITGASAPVSPQTSTPP